MKYIICTSGFPEQLVEEVNRLIGDGFVPVGGVSVAINEYYAETTEGEQADTKSQIFVQAMVQPDKANAHESKIIKRVFNG